MIMIMIFGTLVLNDDISWVFSYFFKIFIFWTVREGGGRVKGKRIAQNEK